MINYSHLRIKENARTHYCTNMGAAIIVSLFAALCGGLQIIFESDNWDVWRFDEWSSGFQGGDFWNVGGNFLALFLLALGIFIGGPLTLGAAGWFQKSIYQQKLSPKTIIKPFQHNYLDNVVTMLLKGVFIFLWSLLFVVPGIVKSYSYKFTEYIKSENPDIPPRKAIEMSMRMTDGAKGDLFYLDLSFFGWMILSALTLNILGIVYVTPYYNAAYAFAYEELKASGINEGRFAVSDFVSDGIVR